MSKALTNAAVSLGLCNTRHPIAPHRGTVQILLEAVPRAIEDREQALAESDMMLSRALSELNDWRKICMSLVSIMQASEFSDSSPLSREEMTLEEFRERFAESVVPMSDSTPPPDDDPPPAPEDQDS